MICFLLRCVPGTFSTHKVHKLSPVCLRRCQVQFYNPPVWRHCIRYWSESFLDQVRQCATLHRTPVHRPTNDKMFFWDVPCYSPKTSLIGNEKWAVRVPSAGCKFNGDALFVIKRGPPGWSVIIRAITRYYNLTAFNSCC